MTAHNPAPAPAAEPSPVPGPNVLGISQAIDQIIATYHTAGLRAILAGLAPHLPAPWNDLAPLLAGESIDQAAITILASRAPLPWNIIIPILIETYAPPK